MCWASYICFMFPLASFLWFQAGFFQASAQMTPRGIYRNTTAVKFQLSITWKYEIGFRVFKPWLIMWDQTQTPDKTLFYTSALYIMLLNFHSASSSRGCLDHGLQPRPLHHATQSSQRQLLQGLFGSQPAAAPPQCPASHEPLSAQMQPCECRTFTYSVLPNLPGKSIIRKLHTNERPERMNGFHASNTLPTQFW